LGVWVSGVGFRVSVLGFRISDFGFRVSGFGFRVLGFGAIEGGPRMIASLQVSLPSPVSSSSSIQLGHYSQVLVFCLISTLFVALLKNCIRYPSGPRTDNPVSGIRYWGGGAVYKTTHNNSVSSTLNPTPQVLSP